MATKVQIKNEEYMPYGGIYFVIREFPRLMATPLTVTLAFAVRL
jgi:hypothetical protein